MFDSVSAAWPWTFAGVRALLLGGGFWRVFLRVRHGGCFAWQAWGNVVDVDFEGALTYDSCGRSRSWLVFRTLETEDSHGRRGESCILR